MRTKLVTHSKLSMKDWEQTVVAQIWVTEPCDAPIFGEGQKNVCDVCLRGWTHEHNYMAEAPVNNKLLNKAKAHGKFN